MAKIKQLIENDLDIFPITHESAVLDDEGRSLNSKYSTIEHRHNVNDIDGLNNHKIWVGTQKEYDAIINKDINTIYFIKEV